MDFDSSTSVAVESRRELPDFDLVEDDETLSEDDVDDAVMGGLLATERNGGGRLVIVDDCILSSENASTAPTTTARERYRFMISLTIKSLLSVSGLMNCYWEAAY